MTYGSRLGRLMWLAALPLDVGKSVTLREAHSIIWGYAPILGLSPRKTEDSDRWGRAATPHQAAKPREKQLTQSGNLDMGLDKANLNLSLRTRVGWRAGYLLAAFGIYMVDQVSKAWAVRELRTGPDVTIIKGFLDLAYTENRGIAFGQLQSGGPLGRWFLVILAAGAAVAVLFYFLRMPRNDDRILGACALLLAGITGNLTDRARFGYVIDFISAHAGAYHWPVFNVADASICLGALLLVYDLVTDGKRKEKVESRTRE